jgi:hypothetical protein
MSMQKGLPGEQKAYQLEARAKNEKCEENCGQF